MKAFWSLKYMNVPGDASVLGDTSREATALPESTESVKSLNNGMTAKIKTDVISYLLSEARYSSFVRVSIILSSFS
jgi:hypothetical protein